MAVQQDRNVGVPARVLADAINLLLNRFAIDYPDVVLAALHMAASEQIAVAALLDPATIDRLIEQFHAQIIEGTGAVAARVSRDHPAIAAEMKRRTVSCPCPNCKRRRGEA